MLNLFTVSYCTADIFGKITEKTKKYGPSIYQHI